MSLTAREIRSIIDEWVGQAQQFTEEDNYLGKRNEPRFYPWSEPLEVNVNGKVVNARGENISKKGVGFVCKQAMRRGDMAGIRPSGETVWIPVRVQHCTQTVGSYKVGASFQVR